MEWKIPIIDLVERNAGVLDLQLLSLEALRTIAERLETIAESLPIPFVPVEPSGKDVREIARENTRLNLSRALKIVRQALDEGHPYPGEGTLLRVRLFDVEALLSAELGQPVWEERK